MENITSAIRSSISRYLTSTNISPESIIIYPFILGENKIKFIVKSWDVDSRTILDYIIRGFSPYTNSLEALIFEGLTKGYSIDGKINVDTSNIQHNEITFTLEYFRLYLNYIPEELLAIIASHLDESEVSSLRSVSGTIDTVTNKNYRMTRYLRTIMFYPELNTLDRNIDWISVVGEINKLNEYNTPVSRYPSGKIIFDINTFHHMVTLGLINLIKLTIDDIDLHDESWYDKGSSHPLVISVGSKIFDLIWDRIKDNPSTRPFRFMLTDSLENAARIGDEHAFKELLKRYDALVDFRLLKTSIYSKSINLVQLLLQRPEIDPAFNNNEALLLALMQSREGVNMYEINNLLIESERIGKEDLYKHDTYISRLHDNRIIKLLLQDPRVNPTIPNNKAFTFACTTGNIEIVRILLKDPRVNPSDNNNFALTMVSTKMYKDGFFKQSVLSLIFDLIRKDPRYVPTIGLFGYTIV